MTRLALALFWTLALIFWCCFGIVYAVCLVIEGAVAAARGYRDNRPVEGRNPRHS